MDTFLPPIEKPNGLMMKLAYYFTRRQFGKVLTPLKVHSARLPPAFGLFYTKIAQLDKKLTLPSETVLLVREQVARINVCLFCMDIGRSFTIKASMNEAKFDALEQRYWPSERPACARAPTDKERNRESLDRSPVQPPNPERRTATAAKRRRLRFVVTPPEQLRMSSPVSRRSSP
jgi:hypothetical protein